MFRLQCLTNQGIGLLDWKALVYCSELTPRPGKSFRVRAAVLKQAKVRGILSLRKGDHAYEDRPATMNIVFGTGLKSEGANTWSSQLHHQLPAVMTECKTRKYVGIGLAGTEVFCCYWTSLLSKQGSDGVLVVNESPPDELLKPVSRWV